MSLFDFFRRNSKATPLPVIEPERLAAKPDPKEPGKRIYHEYFVHQLGDAFPWTARVYAPGGEITEKSGREATDRAAREAALAWAERTKAELRGEA